jgi:hypothetical protein
VVAAEVIVIPRSCSCSIQSMMAVPSWTSPMLVASAGVEQDPLGRRRLARIDVSHDPDISGQADGDAAGRLSSEPQGPTGLAYQR